MNLALEKDTTLPVGNAFLATDLLQREKHICSISILLLQTPAAFSSHIPFSEPTPLLQEKQISVCVSLHKQSWGSCHGKQHVNHPGAKSPSDTEIEVFDFVSWFWPGV